MPDFFALLTPALYAFSFAVTFMGGFVKGAVGFAMPLVMISGMSLLMPPPVVVAATILPVLVTNIWQVGRNGLPQALDALKEHWRYISIVCATILVAAQFLTSIPPETMLVVLGGPVVVLCAIQLAGWRPRLTPRWRRPFEWTAGAIAGTLGGLAGTWGPPTALYLLALDTPRKRQMTVHGVIYGLGSVMLLLGHLRSGVANAQTLPLSAVLLVPALSGMWFGARLGDRFDQDRFRRWTLIVLVIAGGNLVRRGLF